MNVIKFVTPLVVLVFFLLAVLGLGHSFGMEMKDNGTMGGCMFDGKAEICPMTFSDHLSRWHGMLTAMLQKADLLVALFLPILVLSAFLLFNFRRHLLLLLFSHFLDQWRFYLKQNPHLSLFNHLQEAFSQGILKPKIYDFATL